MLWRGQIVKWHWKQVEPEGREELQKKMAQLSQLLESLDEWRQGEAQAEDAEAVTAVETAAAVTAVINFSMSETSFLEFSIVFDKTLKLFGNKNNFQNKWTFIKVHLHVRFPDQILQLVAFFLSDVS